MNKKTLGKALVIVHKIAVIPSEFVLLTVLKISLVVR